MRSSAYHSIVKRKSKTRCAWQVRVNFFCSKLVRLAKCGKKLACLGDQIVPLANADAKGIVEICKLLVIAKDCAAIFFLFFNHKIENVNFLPIKKHKFRFCLHIMAIHH